MTLTKGRIERTGKVVFHDANVHVWEAGIPRDWEAKRVWERDYKRQVFARIVQQLNRLGWECVQPPINDHDVKHYGGDVARWASERRRNCRKGDLFGELEISGCCIKFEMWQSVNTPNRPDHGGRYEPNLEAVMPYVLRLEMERTRRKIRDYLCNVFTEYRFEPPKIASPNPDPLAYFNDGWDSEHEKRRGVHRFRRGADGWPSDEELASWDRKDKDGAPLKHGDIRWTRDSNGRLLRGRVYGGINGMWMFVYGPGRRDYTQQHAKQFFTYRAGETPAKAVDERTRLKRLESELAKAVKAMNFERAAVLRDVIFPKSEVMKEAA
jgi:hypothetical protein